MKKLIYLFIALFAVLFTACGNATKSTNDSTTVSNDTIQQDTIIHDSCLD